MKRNTGMIGLIAAVLVAFAAAPAIAEPTTPFVVGGYVSDADGNPCNGPFVWITNTNTSASWDRDAMNNSSSNYYQLVVTSGDVHEGDVLLFEVTHGSESAAVEHTVTPDNVSWVDSTAISQSEICPVMSTATIRSRHQTLQSRSRWRFAANGRKRLM